MLIAFITATLGTALALAVANESTPKSDTTKQVCDEKCPVWLDGWTSRERSRSSVIAALLLLGPPPGY
jgi:hypothetical protein